MPSAIIDLPALYRLAAEKKLVSEPLTPDIARARRKYKKNVEEPGDCRGNYPLLAGLAIAEADIGQRPGWIPDVQRVGSEIAKLLV